MSDGGCDWCGTMLWAAAQLEVIVRDRNGGRFCSDDCSEAFSDAAHLKAREDRQYIGMPGGPEYDQERGD